MSGPNFGGTPEQQNLAKEIFQLMTFQGAFFATEAPIKQTLTNLVTFLAHKNKQPADHVRSEVEAALHENQQIFCREEQGAEVLYLTTQKGAYTLREDDISHTFQQRLYEPENPYSLEDLSVVISTTRPALTIVEPVFVSDYWQQRLEQSTSRSSEEVPSFAGEEDRESSDLEVERITEAEAEPETEEPESLLQTSAPLEILSEAEVDEVKLTLLEVINAQKADETVTFSSQPMPSEAPVSEPPPKPTFGEQGEQGEQVEVLIELPPPPPPPLPPPPAKPIYFTLPNGVLIDLNLPAEDLLASHGPALKTALLERLDQDPFRRIVRFGNSLFSDSQVNNLGKNALRKIGDYIVEDGEPLTDTKLVGEIYQRNPRQEDYESFRFSLNYRLSRERDFEFVGIEGVCLWSFKGLPTIGTKRIKTSEMAQLTAYLMEGYDESLSLQSAESIQQTGTVDRFLTFFEWQYGILPFDASLMALLPQPMLADQRRSVLRFESPQHFSNYLVEVRYPTGNRGGWLQGLEDFFHEHLVAGALIRLARTEEPNVFTITYEETPDEEDRLLTLDEKKNKLTFMDTVYYCAVDKDQLLAQSRFGKFKNLKALPISDRRKAENMLKHVFEMIGDKLGTRTEPSYRLDFETLYIAYNVLRPSSRPYLMALLKDDEAYFPDLSAGPNLYCYKPEPEPEDLTTDEEQEEEGLSQLWGYDDED